MIDANALQSKLVENPKYSLDWINQAIDLITTCGVSEDDIKDFNADQLKEIRSVFTSAEKNSEIDINAFLNSKLNDTQMHIILIGYSHGLTREQLKPYFDPDIPYAKSNWAILALIETKHDMLHYIKDGYNQDQIREIYSGIKSGINYSSYDDITISAEKMAVARHALEQGLKIQFNEEKELTIK